MSENTDNTNDLAAQFAALQQRRQAEAEAAEGERKRAAMLRAVESAEPFDAAVAKYGRDNVELVDTRAGWYIVKKPHPNNYRKFADIGEPSTDDVEKLVRPCVVSDLPTFERICAELPAELLHAGSVVARLGGAGIHAAGKK